VSSRARPRDRPRWLSILLGLAVLAVVFLLGVGLGLALEERPQTGGTRTTVRTFQPPLEGSTPAATVTVP
jgi:hypothetical protein